MKKTLLFSIQKTVIAVLLFTFIFGQNLHAQDESPTVYLEINKIKKQNDDFMPMMNELVTPFIQERIKNGTQLMAVVFRVQFPTSSDATYDYVVMDVYDDFDDLHLGDKRFMETANGAFPFADIPKMTKRYETAQKNMGSEVFVIQDEAFPGSGGAPNSGAAKFVQVNHMKVSEANMGAYAKMESEVFKPIHQARGKEGTMWDWTLAQRIMPFGSEWDNTFLTFDVFSEWGDIAGGNMDAMMAKVHPGKDADAIWKKMTDLREVRRSETWEIVKVINSPSQDIAYEMVTQPKSASTPPMRGQEVTWRGKMMDTEGKELFATSTLGFDFHTVIGDNPYDRGWEKGLQKMTKGSTMRMTIPAEMQDRNTKNLGRGETVVMEIEVLDIDQPKPDGSALLAKKIRKHGLTAAKEAYQKLQSSNPKGYVFREGAMNMLGYNLMSEGHREAAVYIFELNQKNNPKSWNACDSLADGYMAMGNHVMAKKCYESALKIKPDFKAAQNKLSKL